MSELIKVKVVFIIIEKGKQLTILSTPSWFSQVCRVDKVSRENCAKLVQCLQNILQPTFSIINMYNLTSAA